MEVSGGSLLQQCWLPVSLGGCRLLVKSFFGETEYRVLLTDLQSVWGEEMKAGAIEKRAQELNRRLRAPVKSFFSHLCEAVQPCFSGVGGGEARLSVTRSENENLSVKLRSELAGLPFHWEFQCTPAPVTVVCVQLVRPLLVMSRLLQQQVEQLGGLLLKKDAEIQDYKENGALLSRERLQTEPFEEQTYREDFMSKALLQLCSEQPDALSFDGDLQRLYAAVVAPGNARKRKLSEEDEPPDEEQELTPFLAPGASVSTEDRQEDATGAKMAAGAKMADGTKMADRPTVQQCEAAERPTSKPKKKKAVGLFR